MQKNAGFGVYIHERKEIPTLFEDKIWQQKQSST